MLTELPLTPDLWSRNQKNLKQLVDTPMAFFFHDVHGFIHGSNPQQNRRIISMLAQHIEQGLFVAAVTGYGERLHAHYNIPLLEELSTSQDPEDLLTYTSLWNGALTQHTFTGEIVDGYDFPIDDDLYSKIMNHDLIQAIQRITPEDIRVNSSQEYEDLINYGLVDPRSKENPGVRHGWSKRTGKTYQLTFQYLPDWVPPTIHDPSVQTILEYCGSIPQSNHEMAAAIKMIFFSENIKISTATANHSKKDIDIAQPNINKHLAWKALLPLMMKHAGTEDIESIKSCGVGGGDSPEENDTALVQMFRNGVTNWHYYEGNFTVLDFPDAEDYTPVSQTQRYLELLKVAS